MVVAPFSYLTAHHAVLNTTGAAGSEWGLPVCKKYDRPSSKQTLTGKESKIRYLDCSCSREYRSGHGLQILKRALALGQ